jgi:hypothetical protein
MHPLDPHERTFSAPIHCTCVNGSELARRIFTLQGLVGAAMCSAY